MSCYRIVMEHDGIVMPLRQLANIKRYYSSESTLFFNIYTDAINRVVHNVALFIATKMQVFHNLKKFCAFNQLIYTQPVQKDFVGKIWFALLNYRMEFPLIDRYFLHFGIYLSLYNANIFTKYIAGKIYLYPPRAMFEVWLVRWINLYNTAALLFMAVSLFLNFYT